VGEKESEAVGGEGEVFKHQYHGITLKLRSALFFFFGCL
jgi:hypothetical protein